MNLNKRWLNAEFDDIVLGPIGANNVLSLSQLKSYTPRHRKASNMKRQLKKFRNNVADFVDRIVNADFDGPVMAALIVVNATLSTIAALTVLLVTGNLNG